MSGIPEVSELALAAQRLPPAVGQLAAEMQRVQRRMAHLRRQGLIHASPHWREGRYLYLVHPAQGKHRRRQYIGADPEKVRDAQRGIERAREHDELAGRLQQLLDSISSVRRSVADALRTLASALGQGEATAVGDPVQTGRQLPDRKPSHDNDAP